MARFMSFLILLTTFSFAGAAFGQVKDPGEVSPDLPPRGTTIPIPDDGYDGTLGSMACATFAEMASGTVDDVDVTVAAEHTWIGDLVFKVVSPAGTVATVLSRPGFAELADDGTGCCGDSSNLALTSPITFSTTNGVYDAETMGATLATGGVVCQDDIECDFIPNPGVAADSGDLSTIFDGETAAGTWQFCAGDSAGGDTGNLGAVSFNITAAGGPILPPESVPVPSLNAAGLLVLALLLVVASGWIIRRQRSI